MKPVELFHGEEHAEHVDHDPEDVEDVVSVGSLHQRTGGLVDMFVCVGCQGSTEEGGAEVDSNTGEPGRKTSHFLSDQISCHSTHQIIKRPNAMH